MKTPSVTHIQTVLFLSKVVEAANTDANIAGCLEIKRGWVWINYRCKVKTAKRNNGRIGRKYSMTQDKVDEFKGWATMCCNYKERPDIQETSKWLKPPASFAGFIILQPGVKITKLFSHSTKTPQGSLLISSTFGQSKNNSSLPPLPPSGPLTTWCTCDL